MENTNEINALFEESTSKPIRKKITNKKEVKKDDVDDLKEQLKKELLEEYKKTLTTSALDINQIKEELKKELELERIKEEEKRKREEEESNRNKVLWGKRIVLQKLNDFSTENSAYFNINGSVYDLKYGEEYDVPLGLVEIIDEHIWKLTHHTAPGPMYGKRLPGAGNSHFIRYKYTAVRDIYKEKK